MVSRQPKRTSWSGCANRNDADRSRAAASETRIAPCRPARSFAPCGVAVFTDRRARHVASLLSIKPVARICLYNDAP